jgi:phospholipid transport system substrate-binding protein
MKNKNGHFEIPSFLILLFIFMLAPKGIAGEIEAPQKIIQNISDILQKKLQDPSFTNNFSQVTVFVNNVIEPHVDFDKIAPLVLGKNWKTATQLEQERFKQEFRTLLVRIYSRAFVEYKHWSISFQPLELPNNATKTNVKTIVFQPDQQAVDVSYRMLLNNGKWKVYDIMIDGVSLITNYRSAFSNLIQSKGTLNAVIDDLAKRNAKALAVKKS